MAFSWSPDLSIENKGFIINFIDNRLYHWAQCNYLSLLPSFSLARLLACFIHFFHLICWFSHQTSSHPLSFHRWISFYFPLSPVPFAFSLLTNDGRSIREFHSQFRFRYSQVTHLQDWNDSHFLFAYSYSRAFYGRSPTSLQAPVQRVLEGKQQGRTDIRRFQFVWWSKCVYKVCLKCHRRRKF